ncbi:LamG-like jellyroll fold domain-containing protein [Cytobacillus sp.]|uniref:LamG-like jellyroll fold domain-containing protein n=1 Tax=Cytobacillus sp. TaxID=2675269 RepID=UPI0028BE8F51|nr:LamG-like jellyroll fold domain-containing protein [Cytobacillus sp.]
MFFNGIDHLVVQPVFRNISNSFTYEFWVKPKVPHKIVEEATDGVSGHTGQKYVIGPGHTGTEECSGVGVSVGTNGVSVFEHSSNYLPALLVYSAPLEDWTHVAIVYKDKTPFLYINGELKKQGLTSRKKDVYASGLLGGYDPYGFYIGHLKYINIWDYSRSGDEIKREMYQILTNQKRGLFKAWWFHENITVSPHSLFKQVGIASIL